MTAFAAESAKPEIQTVESAEDKAPVQEDNFILYNEGASNLPFLSEMKERLTEDEFVIAQDISIKAQTDFDIEHDFTKLFFAEEKVKIIFKNAVDEKLTNAWLHFVSRNEYPANLHISSKRWEEKVIFDLWRECLIAISQTLEKL